MKHFVLIIALLCFEQLLFAQKFGYMDSRLVVKQVPEYKEAEAALSKLTKTWQSEVANLQGEVEKMRESYEAKEIVYSDYERKKELDKIYAKEAALKALQNKYFGYEGLLFLKKEELMLPVREKILKAIQVVCRKNRLEIIFDKASDILLIYANPIHNYTELVNEELKPKEEKEEEEDNYDPRTEDEFKPEPATRIGFIESDVIIEQMPAFLDVKQEMENLDLLWKSQMDEMQRVVDSAWHAYRNEEVLLTNELKEQRLEVIDGLEKKLKDFRNDHYGPEGLIYTRRQELMKPLQERIFEATEDIAKEKQVNFIFDKTADVSMIYANPVHNYSDYILEKMELGDPADVVR